MSRFMIFGAFALAAGTALPLAPAIAQPDGYDTGITVTAPHVRRVGRSAIGAPIEQTETSLAVSYSDLDLRTPGGRYELDRRVDAAARDACDILDENYPVVDVAMVEPADCRADAVARARWQVRDAIVRANYGYPYGYSYGYGRRYRYRY